MKRRAPKKTKRYLKIKDLGEGSYGKVYLAKDTSTGRKVAIKRFKFSSDGEGVPASALREIDALKKLSHPNIIKYCPFFMNCRLIDVVFLEKRICMILEHLPYDLTGYLYAKVKLTKKDKVRMFYEIVKAVEYIHANSILHRDLKPKNILVTEEGLPKIADFGLSRSYQLPLGNYTHDVQSLYYRAPEILLGMEQYSIEVDTWSLGCIFYEMFCSKILFGGDSEIGQLYEIFKVLGTPNDTIWPKVTALKDYSPEFPKWRPASLAELSPELSKDGVDLLKEMLHYDPLKRISLKQVLIHPFFGGIAS